MTRALRLSPKEFAAIGGKRSARPVIKPPTEHAEQVAVIQWWAMYCGTRGLPERLLFAIPNGAHLAGDAKLRAIKMFKMKSEGFRNGAPDLMLAWPRVVAARNARGMEMLFAGLFIEMKRIGEKARPEQIEFADMLRRQGYSCCICQGFEEAKRAIIGYLEA